MSKAIGYIIIFNERKKKKKKLESQIKKSTMASHTTTTEGHSTEPILTLEYVVLRPLTLADAPFAATLANDWEIAKNMRNTFPHPYELHHAEWFIANPASKLHPVVLLLPPSAGDTTTTEAEDDVRKVPLHYAIVRRADDAYMGTLGLKPGADVDARTMELGYWLGREFWGKGYVSEAVRGFTKWAFETFPQLLRLEASVHEGNVASTRVLVKVGFQPEGVRRKAIWKADQALDLAIFGMLRSEYPGLSTSSGTTPS